MNLYPSLNHQSHIFPSTSFSLTLAGELRVRMAGLFFFFFSSLFWVFLAAPVYWSKRWSWSFCVFEICSWLIQSGLWGHWADRHQEEVFLKNMKGSDLTSTDPPSKWSKPHSPIDRVSSRGSQLPQSEQQGEHLISLPPCPLQAQKTPCPLCCLYQYIFTFPKLSEDQHVHSLSRCPIRKLEVSFLFL